MRKDWLVIMAVLCLSGSMALAKGPSQTPQSYYPKDRMEEMAHEARVAFVREYNKKDSSLRAQIEAEAKKYCKGGEPVPSCTPADIPEEIKGSDITLVPVEKYDYTASVPQEGEDNLRFTFLATYNFEYYE